MRTLFFLLSTPICVFAGAQTTPEIEWQRCLGGTNIDQAGAIIQDMDGNYVVMASTSSTNGDVVGNDGGNEMWVIKLDQAGDMIWEKTYGGTGLDGGRSICETNDGGYLALGNVNSNDGDVSGNHGDMDIWAVKLDTDGTIEWQRPIGGSSFDFGYQVSSNADGGFLIAGQSNSDDGDATNNQGGSDAWIIKLGATGTIEWQRSLGGSGNDRVVTIVQTSDGGCISAGYTDSNDGDVTGNNGMYDAWVVKVDAAGEVEWQRLLGGSMDDIGNSIQQVSDEGYILAGSTSSANGDVSGFNGGVRDAWLLKLDTNGVLEWQDCFGGSDSDAAVRVQASDGGGISVLCGTNSDDVDVSNTNGSFDFWLLRLSEDGELLWERTMGGSMEDSPVDLVLTSDGGFAAVGFTNSNNGDVSGNHGGLYDGWVVKLSADPTSIQEWNTARNVSVFPNPTQGDDVLTYTLERSAQVQIEIRDASGRLLWKFSNGTQPTGKHSHALPMGQLPAGNYFVALRVDGEVVLRKVVKV